VNARRALTRLAWAAGAGLLALPATAQTAVAQLPPVEVVGAAPLPGLDLPRDQVAAPVQTATGAELSRSGALGIADFMNRKLGSVHINEVQGNPFQPDVNFRGYSASPLLGTAQGLSVYLDGVRLNQPFGDVVSWDLIPKSALASITLMPGSNPLFGLNTLGGALALQTKDGRSHPGTALQLSVGRHGRVQGEVEVGGSNTLGLSWFGTANVFTERGWRDSSPSDVTQLFGKLGWASGPTRAALTLALADTDLYGNGLQEEAMLARDRASVYTRPDQTRNKSTLLNFSAVHELNEALSFSGNAYWRKLRTRTLNGDINEASLDQQLYTLSADDQGALTAAGIAYPAAITPANTPFPYLRCIAQALQNDEPGENCNGLLNRSETSQHNHGVSAQLNFHTQTGSTKHQIVAGAAFDASRVRFHQNTELAYLNPDRSVTGVGAFADGASGGMVSGEPFDTAVNLRARTRTWSLYAADTLSFTPELHLTVAARYNRVTVSNRDQLRSAPDPASLDGDHVFARLNSAIGLTWNPSRSLQFYAGYNEGSRAPTAIELGCANPEQPCKLPNALAGDPPLRQVVTRSIEAGVRGDVAGGTSWRAGVFRADNVDDLLFVADDAAGFGYFKNFGKTRRQGIELGLTTRSGPVAFDFSYTFIDATYRSQETVNGAGNSSNSAGPGLEGTITITPGNHIPLIPRQSFKAGASIDLNAQWAFDLDAVAVSGAYARGNENNAHRPDAVTSFGPGRSAGYAVFNLGGSYRPANGLRFFARVNNLFDHRYATAAQLGSNGFDANGHFSARPFPANADGAYPLRGSTFFAPGAPRSVSVGVRYTFN
jgi:outer membrane receptor protein involved in Fe transport